MTHSQDEKITSLHLLLEIPTNLSIILQNFSEPEARIAKALCKTCLEGTEETGDRREAPDSGLRRIRYKKI